MKILLLFLLLFSTATFLPAREMALSWNQQNDCDGFILTVKEEGKPDADVYKGREIVTPRFTVPDGVFTFYLYAYKDIASDDGTPGMIYSEPATLLIPVSPGKPTQLKIVVTMALQSSNDLKEWKTLATTSVTTDEADKEFFRVKY